MINNSKLPPHLSRMKSRGTIKMIINIFRDPNNWSVDGRNKKSRQWKLKRMFEKIEDEIGTDRIVDHLLESSFWSSIPELQDPKIVEQWLSKMKEPFLCIEPFLVEIAKAENLEEKIRLVPKTNQAQ